MSESKEAERKEQEARAKIVKTMDTKAFIYHKKTVEETLQSFKVTLEKGLSSAEAKKRLEEYGPNELPEEEGETIWQKIVEQFKDTLVQILLAAAIVSFVFAVMDDGDEGIAGFVEPFVILLILALNAIVAVYQDSNADNALEALKNMQAIDAKTLRDGKWQSVPSAELVPGDVVEVNTGDCVPADLRVAQVKSIVLQAGQAALTGESVSVQKITKQLGDDAKMIQDQKNILFSSTVITNGSALGVVAYTGSKTAIGTIHGEVQAAKEDEEDTPLKKKLDQFGDQLAWVIFVICFLVWAMNFNKFFDPVHGSVVKGCIYYFKIAVALAVAAIPEGLPAVITTCLALGTRKMAVNNCIVRRLPSVETLGCTSTICSDKTGTLTKNEMCAVRFFVVGGSSSQLLEFNVEENSYAPIGKVSGIDNDDMRASWTLKHLAATCTLNNRANLVKKDGKWEAMGEPTEAALKALAEKIGNYRADPKVALSTPMSYEKEMREMCEDVATLDFSSERKSMSKVVLDYHGRQTNVVLLKGAAERVVDKCTKVINAAGVEQPMSEEERAYFKKTILSQASQGYRMLGFAIGLDGGKMRHITKDNAAQELGDTTKYGHFESELAFVGLVCIRDPVRPEVKDAIKDCRTAGINVVMITGDAKETAISIAKELNIVSKDQDLKRTCFTGAEFESLTPGEKVKVLGGSTGKVFSRVEPRHKRELVKVLISMGEIVAMTGDGVNDAPALKQAHIGIAMGITGTEVAKQASDMVLTDDNFATIVKAVEEGRSIYNNMKAFIRYLISSNIGEVASIFFTAALGIPEGFNSVQLLWVNLVTDGFPATALGFNPPDLDVMTQKPRKSDDNLISSWTFIRYMIIGVYVGCATVGIFVYWYTMAETGDGHTLVTMHQLTHWTECPNWEGFEVANFVDGMDFSKTPCDYFMKGKLKASTLSLSVLVMIEMFNAFNAISLNESLLTLTPFVNLYLIAAIASSTLLHCMIVYVPFFNQVFSIHSMNWKEWQLVLAFSLPVILIEEVLKIFSRIHNAKELKERLKQD